SPCCSAAVQARSSRARASTSSTTTKKGSDPFFSALRGNRCGCRLGDAGARRDLDRLAGAQALAAAHDDAITRRQAARDLDLFRVAGADTHRDALGDIAL